MSEKQQPIEVVRSMFSAFNRHDPQGLAALYAEDAVIDSPDFDKPRQGPQAVAEIYQRHFVSTPDIRDDVTNIIGCEDKVFVEFVSSGTIENPAPTDPPTIKGKKFSLKICSVLEVKDGKIVRDVTYYDQLALLKQIGLA